MKKKYKNFVPFWGEGGGGARRWLWKGGANVGGGGWDGENDVIYRCGVLLFF